MDQPLLQPVIALCFVYAGLISGLIFSLFTAIQSLLPNTILKHAADGVCVILMFCVFGLVSFLTTGGVMRFYSFLAAGLGFAIERYTIHALLSSLHLKMVHKSKSHFS